MNEISLPSLANMYALSALLQVTMDDIIVGNKKKIVSSEPVPKVAWEQRIYKYCIMLEQFAV